MDISLLLELPAWLEDECELDILSMSRDTTSGSGAGGDAVPSFLVIQSAGDKNSQQTAPGSPQPGPAGIAVQSGRGASVVSTGTNQLPRDLSERVATYNLVSLNSLISIRDLGFVAFVN